MHNELDFWSGNYRFFIAIFIWLSDILVISVVDYVVILAWYYNYGGHHYDGSQVTKWSNDKPL